MVAKASALPDLAAVKAPPNPGTQHDRIGLAPGAGMEVERERPRALVERGFSASEAGVTQCLLRCTGTDLDPPDGGSPPEHELNRRMRNRTYGGVRGLRG